MEKDLGSILRQVQKLISMAEASNNAVPDSPEWHATETQQKAAREKADALMLKYAIDEAMAEAAKPITERIKPTSEEFEAGEGDLENYIDRLVSMLSSFTRVKVRRYVRYADGTWYHRVYGYDSDVRYFVFLYTTLRLHLIGALRPKPNPALSLDENSYVLHNAGYGWREIAEMYGWRKATEWDEIPFGFQAPSGTVWISREGKVQDGRLMARIYRSACIRECTRRGEKMILNIVPTSFRLDAADGYQRRLRERFYEVERNRSLEGGNALALRIDDVEQFMREEMGNCTLCPACGKLSIVSWKCDVCGNEDGMPGTKPEGIAPCPKCKKAKSGVCREHSYPRGRTRYRSYSQAGYEAGIRQANSADISGRNTTSSPARPIGQ